MLEIAFALLYYWTFKGLIKVVLNEASWGGFCLITLNRKQQILNTVSCVYLCAIIVYTLLREIVVLDKFIGNPLLSYAFFGIGFLIIGAKWIYDRAFFQIRNIWILIGFLAVCAISSVLNFRFELVSNVKAIGWMSIFFLLVYPSGYRCAVHKSREMNAVFVTAVITMWVLVALSLPMYFCDIDYTFYKESGALTNQGFSQQYLRLWGLFQDANCAAVYCCVTLIITMYLFRKTHKIVARILLAIAALSMVMYIVLTGSRTVQLVATIVGAWAALYSSFTRIAAKAFKRYALSVLCCALAAAVLHFAFVGIRFSLPYVKYGVVSISNGNVINSIHSAYDCVYRFGDVNVVDGFLVEGDLPADGENELEILDRTDLEGKEDISNGRFTKWSDAIKIFSESPIFGVSPRGISAFGKVHQPDTNIAKYGYSTHNFFLEILTGTGVVGFAVALFILLKTASSILKITFNKRFSKGMLLMSSTVLMLVGASFFESDLFFILTFGGLIFWLMLGNIARLDTNKDIEDPAESGSDRTPAVLVYGLKDPAGGVEKIVLEYVRNITKQHNIRFDFLVFGENFSKENEIDEMGCRVIYMPSRKADMRGYKRKMNTLFSQNDYCAVWGNYSGLTNIDILTFAKSHNIPIRIAHSHVSRLYWGSRLMKYVVFILHHYNKLRLAGYVTHYWACSEVSKKFMFPKSAQDLTTLVNNAVDTTVFCPDEADREATRKSLGVDDNIVVGHVARMCDVKNQTFLLKVVSEAVKLDPKVKLLFVGDGELNEQLHNEAENLGINDSVIFTGARTNVPSLLRAMDVFVLTSLSEGLSVSAVEAQSSGLPCVLSSAVSPDTDISGNVKFIELSKGEHEWAEAVLQLAQKPVSAPGQRIAESGYDIAEQSQKLFFEFVGE